MGAVVWLNAILG